MFSRQTLLTASLIASLASALTGAQAAPRYTVDRDRILRDGQPVVLRGVDALEVFGLNEKDPKLMDEWKVQIVREVVNKMHEQPIAGSAKQAPGGAWLHPLQTIVDKHRAHGRVVILCPFGWDDAKENLFLGRNPSSAPFFQDYLAKEREWAAHFKDQPDVWIELWNEPYTFDGTGGYTPELWLADMQKMVDNVRSVAPQSIIVVPAGKMGGDEQAFVAKGKELLKGRTNLVFDVHCYHRWLIEPQTRIEARLRAVRDQGCALIVGETGALTPGGWCDPQPFLRAVAAQRVSTLAWIWKRDPHDGNALVGDGDKPNTTGKFPWGKLFHDFLLAPRP
jgi:mannan endo-1,4-beta-mannosidase